MSNGPLWKGPRLLPWYWAPGLAGCALAVLVNTLLGGALVCIAGVLRNMAGYDLPSFEQVLEAIPAWKRRRQFLLAGGSS